MRRPTSTAVLLNLPEEQQAKLADRQGVPCHDARARVEKEFGVSLTRLVAFTTFWRRVRPPQLLQRRRHPPRRRQPHSPSHSMRSRQATKRTELQ